MPLQIVYDLEGLARHAKSDVCVFKNAIDSETCDRLSEALLKWQSTRQPNEGRGTNWWYNVDKDGSDFKSFMFWDVLDVAPWLRGDLLAVYKRLFEAHVSCGTLSADDDFENLLGDRGAQPSLDPLAFYYPPGTGVFQRHAHVPNYQLTQVLVNITKRGRDYAGGETLIEEDDGSVVTLGECFDQGDMFSFPYRHFHSVNAVLPAGHSSIGRISVLMPFHPRSDTAIRY